MDLTFYFVALVKNGQISYLRAGPFIWEGDADNSLMGIAASETASGSCTWKVVTAEMSGEFMGF